MQAAVEGVKNDRIQVRDRAGHLRDLADRLFAEMERFDRARLVAERNLDAHNRIWRQLRVRVRELAAGRPATLVRRRYGAGRVLGLADLGGAEAVLVLTGAIRVARYTHSGRRIAAEEVRAPGLIMRQRFERSAGEVMQDGADVLLLGAEDIAAISQVAPRVVPALFDLAGASQALGDERLEQLASRRTRQRLAALLLELRDGGGNVCGHSHAELAARLAVYRETVSKALIQMSEQALIETHRRRITILDDEGLRSLAQG